MKLICIHCGQSFSIRAEQLGQSGRCPHCREVIHLPEAESGEEAREERPAAGGLRAWLADSIAAVASFVFHLVLMLILALISFGSTGGTLGDGEEVFIGSLPGSDLTDNAEQSLQAPAESESETETAIEMVDEFQEVSAPSATAETADLAEFALSPSMVGGGQTSAFDLGSLSGGMGAPGGDGDFAGLIQRLKRDGLDIVFVFDSTGSMGGEIDTVKTQIGKINRTLFRLAPKTRISVCTYRDQGDEYVVKGLPLTSDLQQIQGYLDDIRAGGGGDMPEAVHKGLEWGATENPFRGKARKVMLLFGDAPPHRQFLEQCIETASNFRRQNEGIVSTVTCRMRRPMDEFVEIAQAGGGEAFLTTDERQIMTQLVILIFGSEHRRKVLEAFELMDR